MSVIVNGSEYTATNNRFLPGTYTVDTLPDPSLFQFMYAPVVDLGGGADMVFSDGTYWKHIRRGTLSTVTQSSAISVIPLRTPTIYVITGQITQAMNFVTNTAGLYPGYLLTIKRQNALGLVAGLVGSLGVKTNANGATTLSLTDASTDVMWDGTQFIQI